MVQNVCKRNKLGYCKYGDQCRYLHVDELCDNTKCEVLICEKRHPGSCRFYREHGMCKFTDFCKYAHNQPLNDKVAKQFETKIKELEKLVVKKEKEIQKISTEHFTNKIQIKHLEDKIANQEDVIKNLITKLEIEGKENKSDVEEKFASIKQEIEVDKCEVKDEMTELKNDLKESFKFIREIIECCSFLSEDLCEEIKASFAEKFQKQEENFQNDNSLEQTFINPSVGFECEQCEFVAKTKSGLKTHNKKKHK